MTKDECEKALRHLCHVWRDAAGLSTVPDGELSFSAYFAWVQDNHPRYLDFRSRMSAREDAELWFDQEFGQTWRR